MAIAIGTSVFGAANTVAGNYDTSITPAGTTKGVVGVLVQGGADTDLVTSVSFGVNADAVLLTRSIFINESGLASPEPGGVYLYWAGDSAVFPTGTQTIRVARTGTTNLRGAFATMTVAAGQVVTLDSIGSGRGTQANPAWTHASLAADVLAFLGIHSGLQTMTNTPATGWSNWPAATSSDDIGTTGRGWANRTLAVAGSLGAGWTAGTSEDFAGASIAFKEAAPPAPSVGIPRAVGQYRGRW